MRGWKVGISVLRVLPPVSNLTEAMVSSDFADRKHKKLVLFDVDGTLTPARRVCEYRPSGLFVHDSLKSIIRMRRQR